MNKEDKHHLIELGLIASIFVVLGLIFFKGDSPIGDSSNEPSMETFYEYPLQAWQTKDKQGGDAVKIRYKVERNKTKLYMFNRDGKIVHSQHLELNPYKDGRERIETYTWKLYRTEWTDKIAPGSYQIIVGTTFDTRNPNFRKLTIEIE